MCGVCATLQGQIETVDESLDFAILQRPAEIHGAGGADEIGGKIVLAVRIDGAGSGEQQGACFQRAAADFDAALRRECGVCVELRLTGKKLAEGGRKKQVRLAAARNLDTARAVISKDVAAGEIDHLVAGDIAVERAGPVGKRPFAVHVDCHCGCAGKRKQRGKETAFGLLHLRFQLQDIFIRQKGDVGIDGGIRRIHPMRRERQPDIVAGGLEIAFGRQFERRAEK
ncbi:hypothetical protein D3C80_647470 [compost metagenome]